MYARGKSTRVGFLSDSIGRWRETIQARSVGTKHPMAYGLYTPGHMLIYISPRPASRGRGAGVDGCAPFHCSTPNLSCMETASPGSNRQVDAFGTDTNRAFPANFVELSLSEWYRIGQLACKSCRWKVRVHKHKDGNMGRECRIVGVRAVDRQRYTWSTRGD